MWGTFALLGVAAAAPMSHPCEARPPTAEDRYVRQSLVVFPLEVAELPPPVTYRGDAPDGSQLTSSSELVVSVARGLMAVDYPLERFDTWGTQSRPSLDGDRLVVGAHPTPVAMALACADAAVIPRIASLEIEESTTKTSDGQSLPSYEIKLRMELDVFQRRHTVLRKTQTLVANVPGIPDRVEDVMTEARAQSMEQLSGAMPVSSDKIDLARDSADVLVSYLPEAQASQAAQAIEQFELAMTRVASIARPASLVPVLDGENPGPLGLGWRSLENACFTDPAKPEDRDFSERTLECSVLNRVRQGVRSLQLSTRKVEGFRLFAPVHTPSARQGTFPLGLEEGVRVGDGYWLIGPSGRSGYARVAALGPGGEAGGADPSAMQVVFSRDNETEVRKGREDPRLNIEIGLVAGVLPVRVPESDLYDPDGVVHATVPEASRAPAGTLTFDVNLGRMTQRFELYQTNRISRAAVGPLRHGQAAFGVEKRWLVASRTYAFAGGALGFHTFSVPTGDIEIDEEGNERELRGAEMRIGPEVLGGLVLMVHPAVVVRAQLGARAAKSVTEFTYKRGETEITYVPDPTDGSTFELKPTGVIAGASAAWVF